MRRSRFGLGLHPELFTLLLISPFLWSDAAVESSLGQTPEERHELAPPAGKQQGRLRQSSDSQAATPSLANEADEASLANETDWAEPTALLATQMQPYLEPNDAVTGIDSRLIPSQCIRVADSGTWAQLWLSHQGKAPMNGPSGCPQVDFSNEMVVAVIEPRNSKSATLSFESFWTTKDQAELLFRLPASGKTKQKNNEAKRKKANRENSQGNQYAFFVVPRSDKPLRIRRISDAHDDGKVIASFPALVVDRQANTAMSQAPGRLNLGFAFDPGTGKYNGVVGSPNEVWNFVDVGTTAIDHTRHADGSFSPVRVRVSAADGEWGIAGRRGIYHGYIYHNCQCVDLETRLLDLPHGRYRIVVLAHGDAPDQNARIEVRVDDESWGSRSTGNDGTWSFRDSPYREGVHFVQFEVEIEEGNELKIISHRDGSNYSMFNAIQLIPIES